MSTKSLNSQPRLAGLARVMSGVRALARELVALARAWWRVDRIRVAPGEGELLRLTPGAILRVGGTDYEVVGRGVGENADGPYIVYQCQCPGSGGQAELRVRPARQSGARSPVGWSRSGARSAMDQEDVELVYRPTELGGEG